MSYITDRKRAEGLGSAKSGTEHYWHMTISSAALVVLIPLFVFTFGAALGNSWDKVVLYYSRPFPAIVAALTLVVSLVHFRGGVQTMIEDYWRGLTRKLLIIAAICVSYAAAAAGLFALARLAL